jgi:uncharacterized membrane protein YesL
MIAGLRAGWRGLRHLHHRGYLYIWGSILWFGLSLPLVTAPAAWAAIMRLGHAAQRDPGVNFEPFWEAFKENLGRGLVLALVNALLILMTVVNINSTREQTGPLIDVMRAVWMLSVFVWFTIQLYMWPLFYAMEQPSLWGAVRNAMVMLLLNPGFTLGVWLGVALVLAFSTVFFAAWLLITGGALAAIANSAVSDRLAAAGHRAPLPDPSHPIETESRG